MDSMLLDPLAPSPHGSWSAHGVRVHRRRGPHRCRPAFGSICTPRFCAQRRGRVLTVTHDLGPHELSDELAVLLAEQLVDIGAVRGQPEFELVFTGVVRSTVDGGLPAWLRFYRNSLAQLERGATAFAPVHDRATNLVHGPSVVDLGSCFGFFPLRLSTLGITVTATDLSASTMKLLDLAQVHLRRPLRTLRCDATSVPLPDGATATVTALHLIEHLTPEATHGVIDEALRLARRRVVIAVPFEDEPRECYGHIQRFDLDALHRLGARTAAEHPGVSATVSEYHGGWLVFDL